MYAKLPHLWTCHLSGYPGIAKASINHDDWVKPAYTYKYAISYNKKNFLFQMNFKFVNYI